MPLILVKLPKTEKNIFQLVEVNGLATSIETLKNKTGTGQCFRCQKFGHSASKCHANPKCVKCGEDHLSNDCNLAPNAAAKCANCGQQQPASYKGCEAFPKPQKQNHTKQENNTNRQNYAQVLKNGNRSAQTPPNENIDILSAFVNLQKAVSQIAQMTEIFKQLLPEGASTSTLNK